MARKKKSQNAVKPKVSPELVPKSTPRRSSRRRYIYVAAILSAIGLFYISSLFKSRKPEILKADSGNSKPQIAPSSRQKPKDLAELLTLTPAEMEQVDMARRNLLCATGLPGSEELDIEKSLLALDKLAGEVKVYTGQHMPAYHRNPYINGNKTGSEAYYRALLLVSYLYKPYGITYNPEFSQAYEERQPVANIVAKMTLDSRNSFLHGLLFNKKIGNCASIPALIAAVGQRLGYPIKLAEAKHHCFARWESSTERFNIEGTRGGLQTPSDDSYKKFPAPLDEVAIREGPYLKSLTAAEETACFLAQRSVALFRHKRDSEALAAIRAVHRLAPSAQKYDRLITWRDTFQYQ